MQLCCPFNQNIRYLRHHVDPDRTAVAVLQQMISVCRRNIPQNHCTVIFPYFFPDTLNTFRDIDAVNDLIFLLPGLKLGHNIINRPFPIDNQKLPGRKYPEITGITHIHPYDGEDRLNNHSRCNRPDHNDPVRHQGDLKIRKHIGQ